MIQLDNLASLIFKKTADKMNAQDFGYVFQDLVEACLRHCDRQTLAAQGGAGNPDLFWKNEAVTWGWEVKSSQERTCPASHAAVKAMAQFTNKRLIYLNTGNAPFTLYVADLEGFDGTAFNPNQLKCIESEERELANSLNELLRCMNSALYTNIGNTLIRQSVNECTDAAVKSLGWILH